MVMPRRTLSLGVLVLAATAACSSTTPTGSAGPSSPSSTAAESSATTTTGAPAATTAPAATSSTPASSSLDDDDSPAITEAPAPDEVATDAPVTTVPGAPLPVVVTYSGWDDATASVEVGAYAAGVSENGGTCTLVLSLGGVEVTAQSTAEADATSTTCPGLRVPGAELSPGSWTAVVGYESASGTGSSDPVEVVVP